MSVVTPCHIALLLRSHRLTLTQCCMSAQCHSQSLQTIRNATCTRIAQKEITRISKFHQDTGQASRLFLTPCAMHWCILQAHALQRKPHQHAAPGLQVKEILAYAAQRFIDVVPEIELPGHCGAALASYPYLGCRGNASANQFSTVIETQQGTVIETRQFAQAAPAVSDASYPITADNMFIDPVLSFWHISSQSYFLAHLLACPHTTVGMR